MAQIPAPLLALNRGEVSKLALGRIDVEKLRLSAACQLNWMPWVLGPMMLRPGLNVIGEVLGDQRARLVPFVFSKLDTALLELTPNQMRIWVNDQLVTRAAVATAISDPTFTGGGTWTTANTTSGASVTIGSGVCTLACIPIGGLSQIQQVISVASGDRATEHGLRVVVLNGPVTLRAGSAAGLSDIIPQTVIDTGTHSLAFTPNVATVYLQIESADAWSKSLTSVSIDNPSSGAPTALTLPTPWAQLDLPNIRYDQSGDIVFDACYGKPQYKIERRSTHGLSVVLYRSSDGPFQTSASITANFTPSAYYGNGTLTSDRPYFQSLHVGALYQLFSSGQANQAVLGNQNAFSEPVRVVGVGTVARNYSWTVTGTWAGTLTLQRSFDGPASGFVDVSSIGANGTIASSTGGTGGTPDLDNAIAWERVGFKAGNYTSGSATVVSNYNGGGGYGICRVTGYNSPTHVSIEILQPFSSLTATENWLEADWSGVVGYPTSVAFHEGRLGWFGRDRMWLSASDDFISYATIDGHGNALGDSGPIIESFGYGPVDTVSWGLSLTRLLCGREQSIASARSSNFDQPLTPSAIVIRDCSDQGAERLPAVKVGKRGIFVQQSGRRVYELAFNAQEMDYGDRDLTRLNIDIGLAGFTDIGLAVQPDKMVWLPRGDGQCAALLYDVDDDVVGWWRLQTLGIIENVAVLPAAGPEDYTYFVVNRTVNGQTRRFIEKMAPRTACVGGAINQQLDCALIYQGSPTTSLTHAFLSNTTLTVWADGADIGTATTNSSGVFTMPDGQAHGNVVAGLAGAVVNNVSNPPNTTLTGTLAVGAQYNGLPCEVFADIGGTGSIKRVGPLVVSGGVVTLPNGGKATTIVAFLGFVAPFQSAKLAYAAPGASPISVRKKVNKLGLVLYDTAAQGIQFGQRPDDLDSLPLVEGGEAVPAGTVWPEYEEPMITVPGEWSTDARLFLLAQAPNPCTVGAVVVELASG
jgi:hypothetical protein